MYIPKKTKRHMLDSLSCPPLPTAGRASGASVTQRCVRRAQRVSSPRGCVASSPRSVAGCVRLLLRLRLRLRLVVEAAAAAGGDQRP